MSDKPPRLLLRDLAWVFCSTTSFFTEMLAVSEAACPSLLLPICYAGLRDLGLVGAILMPSLSSPRSTIAPFRSSCVPSLHQIAFSIFFPPLRPCFGFLRKEPSCTAEQCRLGETGLFVSSPVRGPPFSDILSPVLHGCLPFCFAGFWLSSLRFCVSSSMPTRKFGPGARTFISQPSRDNCIPGLLPPLLSSPAFCHRLFLRIFLT